MSGEVVEVGSLFVKSAPAAPADEGVVDVSSLFGGKPTPAAKLASGGTDAKSIARDSIMNVAGFADMVLSLPGQAVGLGADMGMRVKGIAAGLDRRTAAQVAAKFGQEVADPLSNPLKKLMTLFGYEKEYDASDVSTVMNKASGLIAAGGEWVEKQTNGALLKEDVQSLTNALMTAAGGRGTAYVVDPKLEAMGRYKGPLEPPRGSQRPGPDATKTEDVGPAPEVAAAESSAYLSWLERKGKATNLSDIDKFTNAEQRAYDLMQKGASKKEVDAAVARDPTLGEAMAAVRARRGQVAGAESGFFVGGQQADVVGPAPRGPKWQAGAASYMDVPEIAAEVTPVRKRLPLGPLAVGAGAAAIAANELMGGETARDAVTTAAAALTIADIGRMSAATPLSAILEKSDYTLKTFDRLLQNRFEFTREQVMQQLNRPDVGKAEKEIVLAVLGDKQKISAQELMTRFKEVTGDFELKPKVVDDYANYGLEQIREPDFSTGGDGRSMDVREGTLPPARTTIYDFPVELGSANHFSDPNYFAHTRSFDEGGVRHVVEVQSDLAQKAGKVEPISPEMLERLDASDRMNNALYSTWDSVDYGANRAGDYSFFAGLERFKQREAKLNAALGHDNLRMLLEERLVRDLEQAGTEGRKLAEKFYDEAASAETKAAVARHGRQSVDISEGFIDWALKNEHTFPNEVADAMRGVLQRYARLQLENVAVTRAENNSKRAQNEVTKVRPMLKDWHKRVIREELNAAAIANPGASVRFATADTVAKVEGWPDTGEARRSQLAGVQERLASHQEHVATLEAMKRGEAPKDEYYSALKVADPEAFARVLQHVDAEISYAQESLREAQLQFDRTKTVWGDQTRFRPEHQSIYDRYKGDIEKFLTKDLGGKPYTDSAGHTWIEVPLPKRPTTGRPGGPKQMLGFADPKLLAGIAAIGGGLALAANWDELSGTAKTLGAAAIIGLGMIAAGRPGPLADWAKVVGQTAENVLGNVSAELRTMSPTLLRRWTKFEWQSLVRQHHATQAAAPFIKTLGGLTPDARQALSLAAMTGREADVMAVFRTLGKPELIEQWRVVRKELDAIGGELKEAGVLKNLRNDYFPRVVTDIDGLLNALGREAGDFLEQKLAAANRASISKTGDPVSALEASILINRHLEEAIRRSGGTGKAGFLKKRSVDEVTADLLPFYAPPAEALALYMRSASRQVERAKFFGKNLVRDNETGVVNLDDSIGRVVGSLGEKLSREQRVRLEELLRSRFGPGERSSDRVTQAYRNVVQGALLGNPFSAVGQLADVGVTAAMHGTMPTIRALWQTVQEARASVAGKGRGEAGRYNLDDMGLVDRIADEFVSPVKNPTMVKGIELSTANFTDKALKWSGFNFTDEFGKLVNMNAAANSARAKARTPAGRAELASRYGEYFGADFPKLMNDLAAGKKTPLTGELVFRELSDVQPITKLEMANAYVGSPNTRFLYTMKSWMIKQMNLIRERGIREMASGDLARARRGAEFLVRYAALAGIAGATTEMIRNWLMGRGAEMDWKDVPENVLKTFGFGNYVRDKAAKGKLVEAVGGTIIPPYRLFDQILEQDPAAIAYIPVVGKFAYEHFGGGKEKFAEREEKAAKAEAAADDPRAQREKERRVREKERAARREARP